MNTISPGVSGPYLSVNVAGGDDAADVLGTYEEHYNVFQQALKVQVPLLNAMVERSRLLALLPGRLEALQRPAPQAVSAAGLRSAIDEGGDLSVLFGRAGPNLGSTAQLARQMRSDLQRAGLGDILNSDPGSAAGLQYPVLQQVSGDGAGSETFSWISAGERDALDRLAPGESIAGATVRREVGGQPPVSRNFLIFDAYATVPVTNTLLQTLATQARARQTGGNEQLTSVARDIARIMGQAKLLMDTVQQNARPNMRAMEDKRRDFF